MKKLPILFATLVILSGCVTIPASRGDGTNGPVAIQNSTGVLGETGRLLNIERAKNGKSLLKQSALLNLAAKRHADDMVRNNYFAHRGLDGSIMSKRISRVGLRTCYAAENLARGQTTAAEVMRDWMNSPSHRRNNLANRPVHFGIAKTDKTWVLLFSAPC